MVVDMKQMSVNTKQVAVNNELNSSYYWMTGNKLNNIEQLAVNTDESRLSG